MTNSLRPPSTESPQDTERLASQGILKTKPAMGAGEGEGWGGRGEIVTRGSLTYDYSLRIQQGLSTYNPPPPLSSYCSRYDEYLRWPAQKWQLPKAVPYQRMLSYVKPFPSRDSLPDTWKYPKLPSSPPRTWQRAISLPRGIYLGYISSPTKRNDLFTTKKYP